MKTLDEKLGKQGAIERIVGSLISEQRLLLIDTRERPAMALGFILDKSRIK